MGSRDPGGKKDSSWFDFTIRVSFSVMYCASRKVDVGGAGARGVGVGTEGAPSTDCSFLSFDARPMSRSRGGKQLRVTSHDQACHYRVYSALNIQNSMIGIGPDWY